MQYKNFNKVEFRNKIMIFFAINKQLNKSFLNYLFYSCSYGNDESMNITSIFVIWDDVFGYKNNIFVGSTANVHLIKLSTYDIRRYRVYATRKKYWYLFIIIDHAIDFI